MDTLTYTSAGNYFGTDTLSYLIKDSGNASPVEPPLYSSAGVGSITINPVNDAPIATNDNVVFYEDGAELKMNLLGNDHNSDGSLVLSSVSIARDVGNGSLLLDSTTGWITFQPGEGIFERDSISCQVKDNLGVVSNVDTVSISLTLDQQPDDVKDSADAFPMDASEHIDTDYDGI